MGLFVTIVAVFEIVAKRAGEHEVVIDPVCRMQVRPDTAPARLSIGDRTRYFCSLEGAKAFAESPDSDPGD